MNNRNIIIGIGVLGLLGSSMLMTWKFLAERGSGKQDLRDMALLALIKNDRASFEDFILQGGGMQDVLPVIDGKSYTVAEGLSYFDRPSFVQFLQSKRIKFIFEQRKGSYDVLSLSIPNNNPELLNLYLKEKPKLSGQYGENELSLLHLASIQCSHKLIPILHQQGKLSWDTKAKDGSTALTLAAANDCLPVLSYWKDQKANFRAKDGKGQSALSILKKKKDAALLAFAESFEIRTPAAQAEKVELNFYKKRKVPKEKLVDHTALVEPEARPIEIVETAELSEFAD